MWEMDIDINNIAEIRSKSIVYLGIGAISKIDFIAEELKKKGIKKVIFITGKRSYKTSGAWDPCVKALNTNDIAYTLYDAVTPNPTVDQVDEATKMAFDFGAHAVIAIGGGSPIDVAKSVAIMMEHKDKDARDLYRYNFSPEKAAPIVSINLTHGTGTEIDRFAVVSIPEDNHKPYIAVDCIYPLYSIDDPKLMLSLPKDQTSYVSIDAINHVVEAATSKAASPYSIMMAKETIRLVAKYLPIVRKNPENIEARYYLTYASMIGGVSFDNGLLHYTHALEHPLSAVKPDLAHGLGLALLLPSVVKEIYQYKAKTLAEIFEPIVPGMSGTPDEAESVYLALCNWLSAMGVNMGLSANGFAKSDVDRLADLVLQTPGLGPLVSLAPGEGNEESVKRIYLDAM